MIDSNITNLLGKFNQLELNQTRQCNTKFLLALDADTDADAKKM